MHNCQIIMSLTSIIPRIISKRSFPFLRFILYLLHFSWHTTMSSRIFLHILLHFRRMIIIILRLNSKLRLRVIRFRHRRRSLIGCSRTMLRRVTYWNFGWLLNPTIAITHTNTPRHNNQSMQQRLKSFLIFIFNMHQHFS